MGDQIGTLLQSPIFKAALPIGAGIASAYSPAAAKGIQAASGIVSLQDAMKDQTLRRQGYQMDLDAAKARETGISGIDDILKQDEGANYSYEGFENPGTEAANRKFRLQRHGLRINPDATLKELTAKPEQVDDPVIPVKSIDPQGNEFTEWMPRTEAMKRGKIQTGNAPRTTDETVYDVGRAYTTGDVKRFNRVGSEPAARAGSTPAPPRNYEAAVIADVTTGKITRQEGLALIQEYHEKKRAKKPEKSSQAPKVSNGLSQSEADAALYNLLKEQRQLR
jgi:hypothetical protein